MASKRDILEYVNRAHEDENLMSEVLLSTPLGVQTSLHAFHQGDPNGTAPAPLECELSDVRVLVAEGYLLDHNGMIAITERGKAYLRRLTAVFPAEERAILEFLDMVARDPQLDRWVTVVETDQQDFLFAYRKRGLAGPNPDPMPCSREDVAELRRRGHVTGEGRRVTISARGKELVARSFVEDVESPLVSTSQHFDFSGARLGNVIAGSQSRATIDRSPVLHGSGDLSDLPALLDELRRAIAETPLRRKSSKMPSSRSTNWSAS